MIKDYMKKQVIIQAIKWTGTEESIKELDEFMEETDYYFDDEKGLMIVTLEGDHRANIGDYIKKGVKGEFYPCKPDIFEMTYEQV